MESGQAYFGHMKMSGTYNTLKKIIISLKRAAEGAYVKKFPLKILQPGEMADRRCPGEMI